MSGSIKLDLKQFKHVSSDGKTTRLQHKDGHQLLLDHKSLSPEAQVQLKELGKAFIGSDKVKMAEGGEAPQPKKEESATEQAMREFPGDVKHAFSPEGMKDSANLMIDSIKHVAGYADGGKIDIADPDKDKVAKTMSEGAKSGGPTMTEGMENAKKEFNSIFGNNNAAPKKYAEGTPDEPVAQDDQAPQAVPVDVPKESLMEHIGQLVGQHGTDIVKNAVNNVINTYKPVVQGAADVGKGFTQGLDKSMGNTPEDQAIAEEKAQVPEIASQAREMAAQNQIKDAAAPPPGTPETMAQAQTPMGVAPQLPDMSQFDPSKMLSEGYQKQMQGIQEEAKAKAQVGDAQAGILDKQAQAQANAQQYFKDSYDKLENERQNHMADIRNGYIDPEQYWTGHKDPVTGQMVGGHSKVLSAIGLIIAGFNPTNNPNGALNTLKFQMEQNLEAQRQNLNSKQNLLTANLRQFGNLKDATDMTRIMQNDIVSHQLQAAAAKAMSPMAKAAALTASGHLQSEASQMFMQLNMRRAMMNMANNNPSDDASISQMIQYMEMMNPEQAKVMKEKWVPGVGMAGIPVPQNVRAQLVAHQDVNRAFNQLLQFSAEHSKLKDKLTPAQASVAKQQAQTMMNELQSKIRIAEDQGVYKQSEAEFMTQTLGHNPLGLFAAVNTLPKLHTLQAQKQAEFNTLAKSYGLHPNMNKLMPQPQEQQGSAATPQTKTVKGVKYMRGPNGEAVPVK